MLFLNYRATDFQKTTFSIHKNILPLLNFSGKRKYYRELISYEQCKLARIINKGSWAVVS